MPVERPMVLAGLSAYPPDLAGARLRIHQYEPHLSAEGIELRCWSFFEPSDLADWYGPSQRRRALTVLRALTRLTRLRSTVRGSQAVLVQREVLPFGPPVIEMLIRRGRRLIWDVDDSVWAAYVSPTAGRVPRWLRATGDKYGRLCRDADEVWAGSEVLARWCRQRSANVVVIPTVVDVPESLPPRRMARVAGWIGSHSTAPFIEQVLPAMAQVSPAVQVRVVGGRPAVPGNLACEIDVWSPEAEAAALAETSVGLYPIDRAHPLAEGKCGLKAIVFMAAGIPVVITPTETNASIVRDGVEGMHASDPDAWVRAVEALLEDEDRWAELGTAAHRRARDHYSLAVWGPVVARRARALMVEG